jgi:hypothetical protein
MVIFLKKKKKKFTREKGPDNTYTPFLFSIIFKNILVYVFYV